MELGEEEACSLLMLGQNGIGWGVVVEKQPLSREPLSGLLEISGQKLVLEHKPLCVPSNTTFVQEDAVQPETLRPPSLAPLESGIQQPQSPSSVPHCLGSSAHRSHGLLISLCSLKGCSQPLDRRPGAGPGPGGAAQSPHEGARHLLLASHLAFVWALLGFATLGVMSGIRSRASLPVSPAAAGWSRGRPGPPFLSPHARQSPATVPVLGTGQGGQTEPSPGQLPQCNFVGQ